MNPAVFTFYLYLDLVCSVHLILYVANSVKMEVGLDHGLFASLTEHGLASKRSHAGTKTILTGIINVC
jgi:hypothetical protein